MITESLEQSDFFAKSHRAAQAEAELETGDLCCCEYIDKDTNRYHLLACCCNCEEFDKFFTKFVTCRRIEPQLRRGMLLTFQDRLRLPWRGGAKQISWEAIVPALAIPMIILLAAVNSYWTLTLFLTTTILVLYSHWHIKRTQQRTRFYFMWLLWSAVYLVIFFELKVPMMELLPEENLILVFLSTAAVYCFYKTKQRAPLNHVGQSNVAKDDLPDITEVSAAEEEEEAAGRTTLIIEDEESANRMGNSMRGQPNICQICRKYMPPHTAHCCVCGACVLRLNHHSYWLDCCIGQSNSGCYMCGLAFGVLAMILGANLALTAVCHPVLIERFLGMPIMVPDDCSEVFDDYEMSIAFVISLYAVVVAIYALYRLLKQVIELSTGVSLRERRPNGGKALLHNLKEIVF